MITGMGMITGAGTAISMPTATAMTDAAALFRLATWLSPGYPVGAFAYSHGLEWAVETGAVRCRETLTRWLDGLLRHGAGRTDAILLTCAWRAPEDEEIAALAAALQPSAERRLESAQQGGAFAAATAEAWPAEGLDGRPAPYPVAVGRAAAAHGVAAFDAALYYLHAFAANIVSAGVRLIPIGQTDGQKALAALEPVCRAVAEEAEGATLDDLGGASLLADIASMRHETQHTRLFRS
jgi:urease accessory protein